jgi:four helix bundle protein
MQLAESETRLKDFAYTILKFCRILPAGREGILLENNLYRLVSAVVAHFQMASRSRNNDEFISQLKPVLESLEQIQFWLEYIEKMELVEGGMLTQLIREDHELVHLMLSTIQHLAASRKPGRP